MSTHASKPQSVQDEQWSLGDRSLIQITQMVGSQNVNHNGVILQVKVADGRWVTVEDDWYVVKMPSGKIRVMSEDAFEDMFE